MASDSGYQVGTGYDLDALRADLSRFTFLVGGSDGEDLFEPGQE